MILQRRSLVRMTEEEDKRSAQLREEQTGGCLASLPSKATMHLCLKGCHSTFVPLLPEHICATARQRVCLPWSASQCPTMEASVRRPPIVRSRWEWEARHGSGPGPVGTHQTKPFRRQRLPSPSSVRGLWGSDMREGQSDESLELEGTLCRWVMSRP